MASAVVALLLSILVAGLHVSTAAVYIVGDSAGWTTLGNVDYRRWAANKTFHVGDVILFKYHPQFHNVMQVTRSAYKSCNASAPIATHTTGNDSITISTPGHHFFLCGVPGHCQARQKVDINVPGAVLSPILPVSPSSSPSTTTSVITPPPSPSGTAPLIMYGLIGIVGKLGLSMAFFAAFVSG